MRVATILLLGMMLFAVSCKSKSNCNCPTFGHSQKAVKAIEHNG